MASNFALDISRWAEKAKGRMDIVVRKVCLDLFSRVIFRTPVDEGRARGNWQCTIGNIPDGVLEVDDKNGTVTMSRASAAVAKVRAGDVVYLVNNVPYINRLEHGWSKQAPSGMVGITVAEYGGVVQQAAGEAAGGQQ